MSLYLLLDFSILIIPLVLSFEPKVRYCRRFPAVLAASAIVGSIFILWDVLAVFYGDWRFNERFITGVKIASLPVEEILFFFVVPYSCLFIYEVVSYFQEEKTVAISARFFWAVSVLGFGGAWVWRERIYTFAALAAFSWTILLISTLQPALFRSRRYWQFLALSAAAFVLFNGILTAAPVVIYGEEAILGLRVLTIPLEDFFYAFVLLTLNLAVYLRIRDWQKKRRGQTLPVC